MTRRTLFWLGITFGALGCGSTHDAAPHQTAPPTVSLVVAAESLATAVPLPGTVTARRRAEIATRLMARVTEVPVEVGSSVPAGRPLIRLGSEDVAANRNRAAAGLDAAQVAHDDARRHADRMDTLLAQDVVPRVAVDRAHVQLAQTRAQLAMARAAVRDVETSDSYATIPAPFAGRIVARFTDPGDVAAPGRPLLILESAGPRDGIVFVPATHVRRLAVGDRIPVAQHDRRADAPIRAIAAGADPHTRSVEIKLTLPDDWISGTAFTALVPGPRHRGIAVPVASIVNRGQLTGVRVVTSDGVAIRWVRLGRRLDTPPGTAARVEVLSGLAPGDRIVP